MRHYLLQSADADKDTMSEAAILTPAQTGRTEQARVGADDKAMLKAAADLTRDLNAASPAIYWVDLIGSAVLGYAALAVAIFASSTAVTIISAIVAILALLVDRFGAGILDTTMHPASGWLTFTLAALVLFFVAEWRGKRAPS